MKLDKIEPPQFRATVNELNQVTVPSHIRQLYGIESKKEILLELKGEISKTEKLVSLKETKQKSEEEK